MTSEKLYVDFDSEHSKAGLWRLLKHLQGYWSVEIEVVGNGRTSQQNRLYWVAYVAPLKEAINERQRELGLPIRSTAEEVHVALRERFLPMIQKVNPLTGARYFEPQSTTKLSKQEFNIFLEKVAKYAAEEFGIEIQAAH